MSAKKIKEKTGDETWNDYFKFCVVRDPFDKAVSAFFHFKKFRETSGAGEPAKSLRKRISGLFKREPKFRSIGEEFEHWLSSGEMVVDRDKYTIDGTFCLDEVIRYETLQDDMQKICERIGAAWDPALLPTFKAGIRDDKVGLSEIYTPKGIKIISDLYDYELKCFGYKAPVLR